MRGATNINISNSNSNKIVAWISRIVTKNKMINKMIMIMIMMTSSTTTTITII